MRVKILKNIFLFCLLSIVLSSCTMDDYRNEMSFTYKLNSIKEVSMPDTLLSGEIYSFRVQFENPADCYEFEGFHIEEGKNSNERLITAVSTVINEQQICSVYSTPKKEFAVLEFDVRRKDNYVLKFWQGTDDKGQPIYLTKRIEIR